jgi:DUF3037 family protein
MPVREYGQYSLVSYVHRLRGERVNVGVVVWHSRFGWRFPRSDDLKRITCIDRDADLKRIEHDLKAIHQTLTEHWRDRKESPLAELANQFQHGLVVEEPHNARVTDIDFLTERLSSTLIVLDASKAKSNKDKILDKRFRRGFARFAKDSLLHLGILGGEYEFSVKNYNDRIWIAARFHREGRLHLWRTMAFSKSFSYNDRLLRAKAINSENEELRSNRKYKDARLGVAVRVSPEEPETDDQTIESYILKHADIFKKFDHVPTIGSYDPKLILVE